MSYGLNATNFVNVLLNTLGGSAFVCPGVFAQLHTGDPGAAQTANLSVNTTRNQLNFGPAAGGAIALLSTPTPWNMTATESIAAISLWSAATSGVPYMTIQLSGGAQAVTPGDTFTLQTCGISLGPLSV